MTDPNPMPSAADALRRAYEIVSSPCSPAESQRAEILLGIARELREEAQYRAVDHRRRRLSVPAMGDDEAKLREFAARFRRGYEAPPEDEAVAERTRQLIAEAPINIGAWAASLAAAETQVASDDPGTTQRLPVVWSVGDKADCRHCHTPIVVVAPDPVQGHEGLKMWQHKYTQQAVCAVPAMAGDVEGSEPTHTFAQPVERG